MEAHLDVGARIWPSHSSFDEGGTVGCFVCLGDEPIQGPARHFITAAHVVGTTNGTRVFARLDGVDTEVGVVQRGQLAVRVRHDFAVVKLNDGFAGRLQAGASGTCAVPSARAIPRGVALREKPVVKWGSASGKTFGRILEQPRSAELAYADQTRILIRPIFIHSENGFSRRGDSGSIIWTTAGVPIAMLVGGLLSSGLGYALPLDAAAMQLQRIGIVC